jgi:inward rectifier potassium channel
VPQPRPDGVPRSARAYPQRDYTMYVVGERRMVLRDAYHMFLEARWPTAFAVLSIGFFVANLVFAIAYVVVGGVEGARPESFMDALSFSVQTMATIGYGVMHPASNGATTIMIIESMVGIIVTALATGLVFAKFSRATTRVAFSRHAVITTHDGQPMLIFRIGNRRSNLIVDATIHVVASMLKPLQEGGVFYKAYDLQLVRDRQVGMTRGWTVMHPIDERSPLHGLDAAALDKSECEIAISLTGIDSVSTQTVHTVHQYAADDVKFGYRLADTLSQVAGGHLMIDLRRFDEIEPDTTRDSVRV